MTDPGHVELPLDPDALEAAARDRLSEPAYRYFAAGAGREDSLQETVAAWSRWWLVPRVLRDVSRVSTATTVLGTALEMPVMIAPAAVNALAHPDAEVAVARACRAAGVLQVLSHGCSREIEEVAAAGAPLWAQIYTQPDFAETERRVLRAAAAGATALMVTVDLPVLGIRPRGLGLEASTDPRLVAVLGGRIGQNNPGLDWRELERIRALTSLPLVLKGILHRDDANRAASAGVDAIVVSNHGSRQLDGEVPSAAALPAVVEAVAGRCEVYVDSGVRQGIDVLRALALGARAVLVGRPYLWALTLGGEAGVTALLRRLREELHNAMTLCGQTAADAVEAGIVTPRR